MIPYAIAGTRRHGLALLTLTAALTTASVAHGRAYHTETVGDLVARCSTVNTTSLPEKSLELYGVSGSRDTGLASCVLQAQAPGNEPENRQAQVEIRYYTPGQTPRPADVREVREGDLVTYLATYPIRSEDPLQFEVTIELEGAGTSQLQFTDHQPYQ